MIDSGVINATIDRSVHTVLVVDDNPATRYSTARLIRWSFSARGRRADPSRTAECQPRHPRSPRSAVDPDSVGMCGSTVHPFFTRLAIDPGGGGVRLPVRPFAPGPPRDVPARWSGGHYKDTQPTSARPGT